jgi:inosine-uridine nucleoside N-ribohydrolase
VARYLQSSGALAATLVLLSGCGGSSSSDQTSKFKTGISPVVNQFKDISQGIGAAIQHAPSETDAQLAATFHSFAGRWQKQLSQLQTLKAPASVAAAFTNLTGAARRTEADLTAIAVSAQTNAAAAAKQASSALVTDILTAKAAATTITNKLGIK